MAKPQPLGNHQFAPMTGHQLRPDADFELAPPDTVFDAFDPEGADSDPEGAESDPEGADSDPNGQDALSSGDVTAGVQPGQQSLPELARLPVLAPIRLVKTSFDSELETGEELPGRRVRPVPQIDQQPEGAEGTTVLGELIRGFKTWGISFIVHFAVIVLLGLLTFGVANREAISLVASTVTEHEMESLDMQATFDLSSVNHFSTESSTDIPVPGMPELNLSESATGNYESSDFGENLSGLDSMMETVAEAGAPGEGSGLSATFYGIKAEGKRFVFVVDRSSSMTGEPWVQAQTELLRSIFKLTEQQEFFVILFNHEDDPMHRMRGRRAKLQMASQQNVERAQEWVYKQVPFGGTMPKAAVKQAVRLKPDVIFLLSDGIFRDGTLEYLRKNNALKRVSINSKKIIVHTIAFKDFAGANLLQQIAIENGGVFKFVQ